MAIMDQSRLIFGPTRRGGLKMILGGPFNSHNARQNDVIHIKTQHASVARPTHTQHYKAPSIRRILFYI